MQLNIVSALRMMMRHSLSARIVAHFMSLALTAPYCVISSMLRSRDIFHILLAIFGGML